MAGADRVAIATRFSGVVRVDRAGEVELARAYGLAHRGLGVPNSVGTRFGLASGTKGLTALTVMSLVEEGVLSLATPARTVLGEDLPLVADDVTVEHLLAHRSGIGDYVDEEVFPDVCTYLLPVPVHELETTERYLTVLDGHPPRFPAGERFAYCNSGYVVLALIAERVAGVPFPDLVDERVCRPAGMRDTAFTRSDEPPGDVALGYLSADGHRTNVFHLPVVGSGDGGALSTVADVHALWAALFAGRIVPPGRVEDMVRPRSRMDGTSTGYGLGVWLEGDGDLVVLEGHDAGVSFRSVHDPAGGHTATVLSNTSEGAWPLARHLASVLHGRLSAGGT